MWFGTSSNLKLSIKLLNQLKTGFKPVLRVATLSKRMATLVSTFLAALPSLQAVQIILKYKKLTQIPRVIYILKNFFKNFLWFCIVLSASNFTQNFTFLSQLGFIIVLRDHYVWQSHISQTPLLGEIAICLPHSHSVMLSSVVLYLSSYHQCFAMPHNDLRIQSGIQVTAQKFNYSLEI